MRNGSPGWLDSDEFTRTLVGLESRVDTLADMQTALLRTMEALIRTASEDNESEPNTEALQWIGQTVAAVNRFADQLVRELHRLHELHANRK